MPTKKTRRKANPAVQYAVPRRGLPGAALFRRWALGIAGITVRIVGAREGLRLNRKYRRRDRPTNVLTFATGDIVLCDPVVRREAREQGKSLRAHYAHLVVHGVLHLQGHDHLKKKDAERMERKEVRVLRRLGFANPYE
ncbi:MAG: putative rRNA maturation factor [Betaproteobacteria bacterium]|jgi:probable rRNA maturation factor|nr:putative rRNA maturation factor [Betaproteobacteria bacterium]